MIQKAFITQWGTVVPWSSPRLVEQDLITCRALVSIFSDPFLKEHLAFRGGTALHKLYLEPQPRYSEDIDLVQVNAEPIKETMDHLREALSWLGDPVVKQQKFYFEYVGFDGESKKPKVLARKGTSLVGYTQMDLGIAKCHFEIAAGMNDFEWA